MTEALAKLKKQLMYISSFKPVIGDAEIIAPVQGNISCSPRSFRTVLMLLTSL
jgi:hypothetical protein